MTAPRLLTQKEAAALCRLDVKRFRAVCQAGQGPPEFNPDDALGVAHRPLFVETRLVEWMLSRDDRPQERAS